MIKLLSGNKTYLLGIATILYGATGFVLGSHDANTAMELVGQGFAMVFIRQGIAKVGK